MAPAPGRSAGLLGGLETMSQPLVITVAPNGARRNKTDHSALPMTSAEIAREAARCREAGAAMIHLHVRDASGAHAIDPDLYRDAIGAIRREAGREIIIQATTEAVGRFTPAEQMAAMRALQPEAFSVAVRELIPDEAAEGPAALFLAEEARRGTLVQHILYDAGDVSRFIDLVEREVIPAPGASVLFVLGRYTQGQQSAPADLLPLLSRWTLPLPWSLCAFGRREAACATAAACLGGHARIGFENNLHRPDGTLAGDNAELVSGLAGIARALGISIATADEARTLFAAAGALNHLDPPRHEPQAKQSILRR
jgi:3-keto-5-aminohexanoate cleavage enzyme